MPWLTLDRVVSALMSPARHAAITVARSRAGSGWRWTSATTTRGAIAAMALTAGLTLPTLGRQALSWDEAVSASSAQRSLPHLAQMLTHTDAPLGFYYFLLHGWTGVGQAFDVSADNAWWLRLPSAMAAVAGAQSRKPGLWEMTTTMTWQKSPFPEGMMGPDGGGGHPPSPSRSATPKD